MSCATINHLFHTKKKFMFFPFNFKSAVVALSRSFSKPYIYRINHHKKNLTFEINPF